MDESHRSSSCAVQAYDLVLHRPLQQNRDPDMKTMMTVVKVCDNDDDDDNEDDGNNDRDHDHGDDRRLRRQ